MAWFPLESNPDVMNKLLQKLGVPETWYIVDVCGLEPDTLTFVPTPVIAVILLYPCTESSLNYASQESRYIKENGQVVSPNVFFMKQIASHASGTVSLINCIANVEDIELTDGKVKQLLEFSKHLSADDRGELFQTSFTEIMLVHQELALEGQTKFHPSDTVNHQFITFIQKDGYLYELNGRKEFPINHGPSSRETLLQDAARVCMNFIEREPKDITFNVMALAANLQKGHLCGPSEKCILSL